MSGVRVEPVVRAFARRPSSLAAACGFAGAGLLVPRLAVALDCGRSLGALALASLAAACLGIGVLEAGGARHRRLTAAAGTGVLGVVLWAPVPPASTCRGLGGGVLSAPSFSTAPGVAGPLAALALAGVGTGLLAATAAGEAVEPLTAWTPPRRGVVGAALLAAVLVPAAVGGAATVLAYGVRSVATAAPDWLDIARTSSVSLESAGVLLSASLLPVALAGAYHRGRGGRPLATVGVLYGGLLAAYGAKLLGQSPGNCSDVVTPACQSAPPAPSELLTWTALALGGLALLVDTGRRLVRGSG